MRAFTTMVTIVFVFSWCRAQADYSVPYYAVEKPTVKAYLSYELESEERFGSFSNVEKDKSTSREKFDIRTKGWIYHPAFLTFSAGLIPEFKQQSIDVNGSDTQDQENDATFLGYFVDTTFLQYKPYTINLYANKNRTDFSSSLASDSSTESSTYRGQLLLKYQPLPTTITFESKNQVTESFFFTSEKSDKIRIDSKHKTSSSKTKLEAEVFDQIRNSQGTELKGVRNFVYVSNQYELGEKSDLSSSVRVTDNTSGAVDSKTTFLSSQLMVRHREKLKTHYHIRIEDREEGGFVSEKHFAAAELTHQLYENLTTTLSVDIDKNEFTEGNLDVYGAGLDFRYVRRIPWGTLNINLGHRERVEDDQRQLAFAEVRDESQVLTGTDLVLLAGESIDVNSIVVTDTVGLPYAINTDYIVTAVDTSVFISRNSAGGIADGEEVLVDYSFEADPPAKIATISDTFSVNLKLWSMLRLYYNNNKSREQFISGIEPPELTDNTVHRTGAKLRWKWSTTSVEVENRDTTRTPTKRFKFSEALSFRPDRYLSFGLIADYSNLEIIDTKDESETNRLSINFQWDLGHRGKLSADGFSEKVTGSAQRSDRKGLKVLYQWKYGGWRPVIRYVLTNEVDELVGETRKRNSIYFEISRTFL